MMNSNNMYAVATTTQELLLYLHANTLKHLVHLIVICY